MFFLCVNNKKKDDLESVWIYIFIVTRGGGGDIIYMNTDDFFVVIALVLQSG